MFFRRFYDDQLAQASYLLGCQATGQALVVDPNRHVEPYLRAAEAEGLRVTHVTETHIHADFVSGARELAERAGARLLLSDAGGADCAKRAEGVPLDPGQPADLGPRGAAGDLDCARPAAASVCRSAPTIPCRPHSTLSPTATETETPFFEDLAAAIVKFPISCGGSTSHASVLQ